jgi:hypothetical protein
MPDFIFSSTYALTTYHFSYITVSHNYAFIQLKNIVNASANSSTPQVANENNNIENSNYNC